MKRWTDRSFKPEKQHGWLVCGLDARDGFVYDRYDVAEYMAGSTPVTSIPSVNC